MKILYPDFHGTMPYAMYNAFKSIGMTMIMCDNTFPITYGKKWTKETVNEIGDDAECYSWEEFLNNPTDIIIVNCFEHQADILNKVMPNITGKTKLIWYSGNDDGYKYYSEPHVKNILAVDDSTYAYYRNKNINCAQYFPWIDYDRFSKAANTDSKIINCYTNSFPDLFPESYKLTKEVVETVDAAFNYYGSHAVYLNKEKLPEAIRESSLTNVIKRIEGYGFNIIESMAMGRPCIHYKPFTIGRTFSKWLRPDTGIIFETASEYKMLIERYFNNESYRYALQDKASKVVRNLVDNDQQNLILKQFMENLI